MMRLILCFITYLLLSASSYSFGQADVPVVIAVNEDILPDYQRFLDQRDPLSIHDYSGPYARRDVIELLLLNQAVRLGGFTQPIELRAEQSYLRTLRDIGEGRFITSAGLAWRSDIEMMADAFYISRPLIKQGEFVVGLYTSANNQTALAANTLAKLKELSFVTSAQWKSDVTTLKELGITHITYSPNWVNMARMIEAGRADLTLAPFQTTPDLAIKVGDVKLFPVRGVKIAFAGSRHWPISRKHPQGEAFFKALERGLALLDQQGMIQKAYSDCGFFNADVAQWTLLTNSP
jgi:hypothetical protein